MNDKNKAQLSALTGEPVEREQQNFETISSKEVAKMMEIRHWDLLEKIDNINKDLATENSVTKKYWFESSFRNRGKNYREYQITKRGCEFLAHKTTGSKGNIFTDRYMDKFEEMKTEIEERSSCVHPLSTREMMREQLNMIDEVSERVDKLENNMVIDYGQQRVLERLVSFSVINALGGKETEAYRDIGKKVFSECNRDIKDYFNVNSRNNIPKCKFDDACLYIKSWQPCTNTKILISNTNAQTSL